jgi:hypothetical protein
MDVMAADQLHGGRRAIVYLDDEGPRSIQTLRQHDNDPGDGSLGAYLIPIYCLRHTRIPH